MRGMHELLASQIAMTVNSRERFIIFTGKVTNWEKKLLQLDHGLDIFEIATMKQQFSLTFTLLNLSSRQD